jgi:Sulfotransferase family
MPRRYISHRLGIEYLELAKCACTSLKRAMLEADGITATMPREIDNEVHFMYHADRRAPSVMFRFTFVRHPVTRFISMFRNKIRNGYLAKYAYLGFPQRTATPLETLLWIRDHLQKSTQPDKHFQCQTRIRKNRHNPQPSDYIGHLETISDEWRSLQQRFDLPNLQHWNKTEGDVQLDDACLNLIAEIYKDDFVAYGYTIGDLHAYQLPTPNLQPYPKAVQPARRGDRIVPTTDVPS